MVSKIRLEIWAGALGVPVGRNELDSSALSAEEQHELQELIDASKVRQLPASPPPSDKTRDENQFKFTFDSDGREQIVRIQKEALTPELRQLIDFVHTHGG